MSSAQVASDIAEAIRSRVPKMLLNFTTGTIGEGPSAPPSPPSPVARGTPWLRAAGPMGGGKLGPVGGPLACIEAGKPEIAALNAGSLNYLKVRGAALLMAHRT